MTPNQQQISNDIAGMSLWRNDNGNAFGQGTYFGDDAQPTDKEYFAASRELSNPYIVNVVNNGLTQQVQLFGASVNSIANNFGNSGDVVITSQLNTWQGAGGTTGYQALLSSTVIAPFYWGKFRNQCPSTVQLQTPLNFTANNPTGFSHSGTYQPIIAINQFNTAAVELATELVIDPNLVVSYSHLTGAAATACTMFIYAASVATLRGVLKGRGATKAFTSPNTIISQPLTIQGGGF